MIKKTNGKCEMIFALIALVIGGCGPTYQDAVMQRDELRKQIGDYDYEGRVGNAEYQREKQTKESLKNLAATAIKNGWNCEKEFDELVKEEWLENGDGDGEAFLESLNPLPPEVHEAFSEHIDLVSKLEFDVYRARRMLEDDLEWRAEHDKKLKKANELVRKLEPVK